MTGNSSNAIASLEVFLTAGEAFPAFERLFLQAEREISCGFRIFDLTTRLRSPAAKREGEIWFDLFERTLGRGVDITLVLTDFDPIVGTKYHRKSWESARQLAAVQAVAGRGKLTFRIAQHPAKAGLIPRLLLRRKVRERYEAAESDRHTPGLKAVSADDVFQLSPVTHHQKLAVFDRKTLYIGGLDLDERRFDTPDHARAAEETWQDIQAVVTGPVVAAAQTHLEQFEAVVARKKRPAPKAEGFLRTMSTGRSPAIFRISPRSLVTEIEDAHLDALSRADSLIYLETQFFRHMPLAKALAAAGRERTALHLIVVLPAAPEDVAFEGSDGRDVKMGEALQADCVEIVRDGFGERVLLCSPARRVSADDTSDRDTSHGSPIIYVHSKVSIFDDREAILSSANLNGRSLRWDTEAGLHLTRSEHVRALKDHVLSHWMPPDAIGGTKTDEAVFLTWKRIIEQDAKRAPEDRVARLVPYSEDAAREMGESTPYVPNELV